MALDANDVVRLGRLARLDLPADQQTRVLADLNRLFELVGRLAQVDTRGVEPLAHPLSLLQDIPLRLRDDVVTEPATAEQRETLMANAPARHEGLFLVPRVIE
jgi:aspartyl-tRNA(Asn)/glutamyl-tRNA(Gln) amidotransferase subunit C